MVAKTKAEKAAATRLKNLGYDLEKQTRIVKERLIAIESIAEETKEKRHEILKELKNTKLNITNIAEKLDVTRQALYKDEIVNLFIESCIDDKYPEDDLHISKKKLIEQIATQNEMIKKMEMRDVNDEEIKLADEKFKSLHPIRNEILLRKK